MSICTFTCPSTLTHFSLLLLRWEQQRVQSDGRTPLLHCETHVMAQPRWVTFTKLQRNSVLTIEKVQLTHWPEPISDTCLCWEGNTDFNQTKYRFQLRNPALLVSVQCSDSVWHESSHTINPTEQWGLQKCCYKLTNHLLPTTYYNGDSLGYLGHLRHKIGLLVAIK